MKLLSCLALLCATMQLSVATPTIMKKRSVSTTLFDDLKYHFQYATTGYFGTVCAKPNGNTLVGIFNDTKIDTHGFVVRDDKRKEIAVVFRGTASFQNFATDFNFTLVPFVSPGVKIPNATIAGGYLLAYNVVAAKVFAIVKAQIKLHPSYRIATVGHSLGGALSSIAAVSLKQNFPTKNIIMYTYGQPRTGNQAYATWVNKNFGPKAFRTTHTDDGVVTIAPTALGFRHHGIEYWLKSDPASAANTTMCNPSGEDLKCCEQYPSGFINGAHLAYFGIFAATDFCG